MLAGDRKGFSLYRSETGIPSRKQMIQDKLLDAEGINTLSDDQNLIEIKGLSLSWAEVEQSKDSILLFSKMSTDLQESCWDLKVLGKRELTNLLKWRMNVRREYEKVKKWRKLTLSDSERNTKSSPDLSSKDHESIIDWELLELKEKLRREEKAKAKKLKEE